MRRRVGAALIAVAMTTVLLGTGSVSASRAAAPSSDPKAILRVASDLSTFGGPSLDPIDTKGSPQDYDWDVPIYDTLVHVAKDGSFVPGLAKSWTIVDPQTVQLELRPNVKFQDGTPFDADAVKAGLERTLASDNRSITPAFFDLASVEKTGPLALTLHLSSAAMDSFFPSLTGLASFIPSPAAVAKGDLSTNPVGAGPMKFETYTPEQLLSERKWNGYWNAKAIKIGGIDFIQTATGPSTVNALLADTVDLVTLSNTSDAAAIQGRDGVKTFEQASPANTYLLTMCTSKPPFDKLVVRQALAQSIDREAINKGALDGHGSASPLPVREGSQYYFPELANRYPYNPKAAKKALKKNGAENLGFDLIEPPVPSFLKVTEVVQGQLDAVGVKTNTVQSTNVVQDLFIDNKAPAAVLYTTNAGLPGLLPYLQSDGLANLCKYSNPKVDDAIAQIQSALGDQAKLTAGWKQLETALVDDVPMIFLASPSVVLGMQDRVHGVNQILESGGINLEGVTISK